MLDVTPEIDENNNIILHIHPSVSHVTQTTQSINLGGAIGTMNLPTPVSSVSETDSIVRTKDGEIVAIGGLMTQNSTTNTSQVPGLGDRPGVGGLFGQDSKSLAKTELVILLKATVVKDENDWSRDMLEMRHRVREISKPSDFGG
jgi:MSHA biogenesis protein MshL